MVSEKMKIGKFTDGIIGSPFSDPKKAHALG